MHRPRLFSWVVARPIALLLTVGVLLVGLSACGSSASTNTKSKRSSATVVKKKAGLYKDVQLEVVNDRSDGGAIDVTLCNADWDYIHTGQTNCSVRTTLGKKGDSTQVTFETVSGYIYWQFARYGGQTVWFKAANPAVGEPYFDVWESGAGSDKVQSHSLSEGEIVHAKVGGFDVQLERRGDTGDVKVMRLLAQ